jgi:hypothetical protein
MNKMLSYNTDYFIREPHPRKLYLYLFDWHFLTLYGKKARRVHTFLNGNHLQN